MPKKTPMATYTVRLPDELNALLIERASREEATRSEVIRDAVTAHLIGGRR